MELLLRIFQLSIMGSIIAGIILLAKHIFNNQLGAKAHYYIWIFLLIRLLVPCLPDSPVSLFNVTPMVQQEIKINNTITSLSELNKNYSANNQEPQKTLTTNTTALSQTNQVTKNNTDNLLRTAFIIWLTGGLLLGAIIINRNLNFWLKIKELSSSDDSQLKEILTNCRETMNVNSKVAVIKTNLISSPTLYGLLKPKILLPKTMANKIDSQHLKHIFLHELAHLKRKDIFINCLTTVLQLIHWFNPLLWYAFYRLKQDQELAADHLALSHLQTETTIDYGRTIIDLVEKFSQQPKLEGIIGFVEQKSQIKRRLQMIKSFKQKSKKLSVLVLVLFILLGSISLTNAQQASPANSQQIPENIKLRINTGGVTQPQTATSTINAQTIISYYNQNSNLDSKAQGIKLKLPTGRPILIATVREGTSLTVDNKQGKQSLTVAVNHKDNISTIYRLPAVASAFITSEKARHKKEDKRPLFKGNMPKGTKFLQVTYPNKPNFTPYLHFKIVKKDTTINPLSYLK